MIGVWTTPRWKSQYQDRKKKPPSAQNWITCHFSYWHIRNLSKWQCCLNWLYLLVPLHFERYCQFERKSLNISSKVSGLSARALHLYWNRTAKASIIGLHSEQAFSANEFSKYLKKISSQPSQFNMWVEETKGRKRLLFITQWLQLCCSQRPITLWLRFLPLLIHINGVLAIWQGNFNVTTIVFMHLDTEVLLRWQ